MQSKPKSNSVITSAMHPTNPNILVTTVLGCPPIEFDRTAACQEARNAAEWNGWTQRFADRGAMPANKETGRPATPQEKYERIKAYVDHVAGGGAWAMKGAARVVVKKGPNVGQIIMAMIRAGLVLDIDAANGRLNALATKRGITRDEAAELFERTPQIIDALAAMAKEQNVVVSVDELMGEDEGDGTESDDAAF